MKTNALVMVIITTLLFTACSRQSSVFETAVDDVKENKFAHALPVLEAESKAGNRDAQVLLAKLYAAGIGVDKNSSEAAALLTCKPASSCVSGKAEYYLGMDFLDGAGVSQNRTEAEFWFRVSSSRGYSPADEKLSELARQRN